MNTMERNNGNNWYVRPPNFETAKVRLFCFPYAGGGAWIFRDWVRELAPDIAVCAVKLPGRGDRFRDPAMTDLHELARAVADALEPDLKQPYAMFGHSMGALLAFECLQNLQLRSAPAPLHLIASAARAPLCMPPPDPLHQLPDTELIIAVQQRFKNPFMKEISPDTMELILPPLRADITAFETYTYRAGPQLSCPVTIFSGRNDTITRTELETWAEHTAAPPSITEFDGGHFFIHDFEAEARSKVLQVLLTKRPEK